MVNWDVDTAEMGRALAKAQAYTAEPTIACDGAMAAGIGASPVCVPHHPDPKEALNQRLYQVGYNLQELERIRAQVQVLRMDKAESLIDAAIELMATAWLEDRRTLRSMG